MEEVRIGPGEWDDYIAQPDGPQLIVAGPGAGKTEFLVRRALHLIGHDVRPDEVLVLSFSRRSAADMRGRIEAGLEESFTRLAASTFHSLAYRLLEAHAPHLGWEAMPSLLTSPEQVQLVFELLQREDPSAWHPMFRPIVASRTFAQEVAEFVARCHERLIGSEALAERAPEHDLWRGLPAFLDRYEGELRGTGRIDYGMLQAEAVRLLDDQDTARAIAQQFPYVLVDEYQDTTLVQSQLLNRLFAAGGNITVAGDPYQSIYSFRGTELDNIKSFPEQFRAADGSMARRIVLTTSFRVPQAVLRAAERITAGGELPGAAGEVLAAGAVGAVDVRTFGQQTEEAEWIASEVHRLHLADDVPYSAMAVLARSKRRFVPELSRALRRHDVPHDRPDTRLADDPAIRLVLDLVIAATETGVEQDRAVRRLVLGPLLALPVGRWRELERRRARNPAPWHEVLGDVAEAGPIADLIAHPEWASDSPAEYGFWHAWSRVPQFVVLASGNLRRKEREAWASLGQVLGRFNERNPVATLRQYLELHEAEEFEATPLLAYRRPPSDMLTITTLHQAKGLEFDIVFIADAVEGVLPDLRPRESLLGARLLADQAPLSDLDYRQSRLREEMRLAYTAMCRARRRVVWTATASGIDEGQTAPSRFIASIGIDHVSRVKTDAAPASAAEAEALLRRTAADPGLPHARRLAAVSALAAGQSFGLRPPESFHGFRAQGPDTGVVGSPRVLSPTQAQMYEDCPRRYALERRLGVADDESVYLLFGLMFHELLERAELAAIERGERSTANDAMAALDDVFDSAEFGGEPWATAWRRRAEGAITHLYDNWPEDSLPVLAVEYPLELELAGTHWQGKADRIEGDGETLRIVDYKTTRSSPPTREEAATSLQLGMYVMAAGADPELQNEADRCAAEMWFPAIRSKSLTRRLFDPDNLEGVAQRLLDVAEGITGEDWTPRPSDACDRCTVRIVCPAWPEGRAAY